MNEYPQLNLLISQLGATGHFSHLASNSSSFDHSIMILLWRTPLSFWIPTACASIKGPKHSCPDSASPLTSERVSL